MDPSVKKLFDAGAKDYDWQRKNLIPCYDDFYGTALSLVESADPSPRILDLGAGTGLLSGLVLQKYPQAQLTLIDFSDPMLDKARQRFSPSASNVQYIAADYSDYAFTECYDFIISSLSIHHLPHAGKRKLFANVYHALRDGGVFVNADQARGPTPETDAYYKRRWMASVRASGLAQEMIDASVERRKHDINASVEEQIRWMEEAGFNEVDCMYKNLEFAVFYGKKAR
ncbi:class I SAM-dependent methyltransferase [Paenibacillus sp. J2TS4]|uniref:class I SAM-dependent methyltransferase n=1 Tax=Paenibacillus sp. J2TS4 TaxID=2807194 RepID=UPI001B20327E|nr:class I SAM-dependent methyltransferase [Paenibacillus sp. J2TS4]GIP36462.1 SAM-dependent methyltransferase [Paenibacillus sp. J2TS4]